MLLDVEVLEDRHEVLYVLVELIELMKMVFFCFKLFLSLIKSS